MTDTPDEEGLVAPPRQRGGRRTLLTPELQEKILEYVEGGNYLDTAAALAGVDRTTVFRWTKRGVREIRRKKKQGGRYNRHEKPFVDFYRAFMKARATAEARNVANINLVARGQPAREIVRERILPDGTVERTVEKVAAVPAQWTASAWYLERTNKDRWGRGPYRSQQPSGQDTPPAQQEEPPPAPLAAHTEEGVISIVQEIAQRANARLANE